MSAYPAITELVPHAPPMLAIEELTDWSPGRATARLAVREDSLFVRAGRVDAVFLLEYMAQTVAACLGYEAYQEGHGVRVGMVIACRDLHSHCGFVSVGDALVVHVERERGTDAVSHFAGRVEDAAGTLLATAAMTLVHGVAPPPE